MYNIYEQIYSIQVIVILLLITHVLYYKSDIEPKISVPSQMQDNQRVFGKRHTCSNAYLLTKRQIENRKMFSIRQNVQTSTQNDAQMQRQLSCLSRDRKSESRCRSSQTPSPNPVNPQRSRSPHTIQFLQITFDQPQLAITRDKPKRTEKFNLPGEPDTAETTTPVR